MASSIEEVSKILDGVGWGRYQVCTFFVLGLCWCNMLAWQACISISLQEASSQWGLSSIQIGGIGSCHTFGILIGSYFWGYLGNTKGRLITLKLVFTINACIGLLYTCAINYAMLCISAILIGFCGGGAQVLSGTLYMESLPSNKQWTLVLLTIFISIGGILGYLIAIIVEASGTHSINIWRWVGGFDILLMITTAGLLFTIFESPKFLICQKNEESSELVLR
jgi:MFS family permease